MTTDQTKIITDKYEISLLEKGIILNHMAAGAVIDVKEILEMKENNVRLAENQPYTMLITTGHLTDTTNAARNLTAKKDFNSLILARALLTNSIGHMMVANFYLRVNAPTVKTKLFSDREKALAWLRTFL